MQFLVWRLVISLEVNHMRATSQLSGPAATVVQTGCSQWKQHQQQEQQKRAEVLSLYWCLYGFTVDWGDTMLSLHPPHNWHVDISKTPLVILKINEY